MLLRLRLCFADRPDYELAIDSDRADADAWTLLRSQADEAGRIALGDRESCTIDEVLEVRLVHPTRVEGPGWRGALQDEDVAAALDENYEEPTGRG
jgi:hypothetical protein